MTRESECILDLLVSCPWWVSVLVSGFVFVFVKFIQPSIDFQTFFMNEESAGAGLQECNQLWAKTSRQIVVF
jgi:hypothetical protein